MSKFCPIVNHNVVYLTCQECENKICNNRHYAMPHEATVANQKEEQKSNGICADTRNCLAEAQQEDGKQTVSCNTCNHCRGIHTMQLFGRSVDAVSCVLADSAIIDLNKVNELGCDMYNVDLSNEMICLNCRYFLGGNDWGLACEKHYHRLPSATNKACDDFERRTI